MPTLSIGTRRLEIYSLTLITLLLSVIGMVTLLPTHGAAAHRDSKTNQVATHAGAAHLTKAQLHTRAVQRAEQKARALHHAQRLHQLSIRKTALTGPPVPVTLTFTATPPASTEATSATIKWSSPGAVWTHCDLDHGASFICTGDSATVSGLAPGSHTFAVAASTGGPSKTANVSWTVVAKPAATPPDTRTPPKTGGSTPASGSPTTSGSGGSGGPAGSTGAGGTTSSGGTTSPGGVSTPTVPGNAGVTAPTPPTSYSIPGGATVVSTSAQLSAALGGSTAQNIVLADGTYDSPSPFQDGNGSHLYAQHLGGAVLTTGLVVGGNFGSGGAVVQGLAFDVSSAGKAFQGGEINVWGPAGENLSVLDTTFDGNRVIPIGLDAVNPDGLVAQRLTFTNFTDEGIRASDNKTVAYGAATPKINTITDIFVNGVSRSTPGASNGTAEAGIWVGQPVVNGVHRIKIRNVSWSGIETVSNAWNTTYSDLDIDMSGPNADVGVAVYIEHFAYNLVFTNFAFTGSDVGFKAEWADPAWGGVAASHHTTIENGSIDATGWNKGGHTSGIFLDQGTDSTTISNVTFKGQNFAAIDAYDVVGTNNFTGESYVGVASQVSSAHM
jgi:hypothetical protein